MQQPETYDGLVVPITGFRNRDILFPSLQH